MLSENIKRNIRRAPFYILIGAVIGYIFATVGSSTGGT